MQIVIDKESLTTLFTVAFYAICGEDYSDVKNTVIELLDKVGYTPLPEGHGKIIDVADLLDRICLDDTDENREDNVGEIITLEDIDFIPAIIEADMERSDEE